MSDGHFEAKLSAKRETAAGIYLTFQVQPDDYNSALATLRVGSALMMGWAEVVDSKVEPIFVDPNDMAGITDIMRGESAKPKDRKPFASLPLSQQAAIRTDDINFQEFLETETPIHDEESYADAVRSICGVESRSDIRPGTPAAISWMALEARYQAWLTTRQYADSRR